MEMDDTRRWVLLIVLILVVFARGPEHHRGSQQVGAFSDGVSTAAATPG